jgi:Domain of unknown function (DUF4159)
MSDGSHCIRTSHPRTFRRTAARIAPLALIALLLVSAAAYAQFGRGFGGFFRIRPRFADANTFGHGFNYCRVMYTSNRREAGGQGWSTDYPDAERNFSKRLGELTKMRVSKDPTGEPNHIVVRLTDPDLYQCAYISMEDAGTALLSDAEVEGLRAYLLKGGFLWLDDYWGDAAYDQWVHELDRVLPPTEYPIFDHPVFRTLFDVKKLPQIPSIQFWRGSGGDTSERGEESAVPDFKGVNDKHGNLIVIMMHDTDVADSWEREGEDVRFFYEFSPDGYAIGLNVLMYAMTH